MKRAAWLAVAVLIAGFVTVRSEQAWRRKALERELRGGPKATCIEEGNRFVDFGVELRVVRMDLEHGRELLPGKPLLTVLRRLRFGGMVDTKAERPFFCAPSADPIVWYCSEDQERIIVHSDQDALGQLVYGAEGAGKTACLVMWQWMRILEHIGEGREGGCTAPTNPRLEMVRTEIRKWWRPSWYRYKSSEALYEIVDGTRLRLVSTHRQSAAQGSRVQGYSWSWASRDEAQDQIDVHEDIESRGREATDGQYKQLATATAKDTSAWREFRDVLLGAGPAVWIKRKLNARSSPFVATKFWDDKKRAMDPREYARRIDPAEDQGLELGVYHSWDRARNLVARPQIALDVTADVLASYQSYVRPGARFSLLAGHDPGNIYNTTTFFRLLMFGAVPTWMAVGELQTKQTTAEQHARAVRDYVRSAFAIEQGGETSKVAIMCDPHGRGEAQTDYQTVYMAFQREGLDVFSAAPITQRIKRSARVGMINRLLVNAEGVARLVVGTDERRKPLAPVLVDAFESLEKQPGDDNPEGGRRKDENDRTHAPASAGYALWLFEQEAVTDATQRTARIAAKRLG